MDKKEGKFKDQPIAAKKKRSKKEVKETCLTPVLTAIGATITIAGFFVFLFFDQKDTEIKMLERTVKELKEKLAGYIVGDHPSLSKIDPCQEYEWQWAGENWYGRIKLVKEDEDCKVKMARVFKIKKDFIDDKNFTIVKEKLPILELIEGEFTFKKPDGLEIELIVYKETTGYSNYVVHKIKCDLKAVLCFAGKITYLNSITSEEIEGDMVLVNYKSLEGDDINVKFSPTIDYSSLIKKEIQPSKKF